MKKISSIFLLLIIFGFYKSNNQENSKSQLLYEYNSRAKEINNLMMYEYVINDNSKSNLSYEYMKKIVKSPE